MTYTLHFHPLASYCHKALIALYEAGVSFTPHFVDLADAAGRAAHLALWPIGKMPVLVDQARGNVVPEATVVIEYLASHEPAARRLVPEDPAVAWQVRLWDRYGDLYLNDPMGKIVTDNLRPAGLGDPHGVEQARAQLRTTYDLLEQRLDGRTWLAGDDLTMADCAVAAPLAFAARIEPLAGRRRVASYLARVREWPSFARVLQEAEPYIANVPVSLAPVV
jgi:glutathione S-transferase